VGNSLETGASESGDSKLQKLELSLGSQVKTEDGGGMELVKE